MARGDPSGSFVFVVLVENGSLCHEFYSFSASTTLFFFHVFLSTASQATVLERIITFLEKAFTLQVLKTPSIRLQTVPFLKFLFYQIHLLLPHLTPTLAEKSYQTKVAFHRRRGFSIYREYFWASAIQFFYDVSALLIVWSKKAFYVLFHLFNHELNHCNFSLLVPYLQSSLKYAKVRAFFSHTSYVPAVVAQGCWTPWIKNL